VGFADPAHFGGGNIGPAITETVHLLAFARRRHWPVAHTRVVYAEDGADAGVFTRKAPSLLKLTEASPLSQIVPELAPAKGEHIVRKQGASGFFGTGLAAFLTARGADTVIVVGCTTSGCVRARWWIPCSTISAPSSRPIASATAQSARMRRICSTWARNTRT
jgi:maleamate amidohydrolase